MDYALDQLSRQWALSSRDQQRLMEARVVGGADPIDQCLDIAAALNWLLADRSVIRVWLRTPHIGLYHQAPIDVAFGSATGRLLLRATLMNEAAACGDLLAASGQTSD